MIFQCTENALSVHYKRLFSALQISALRLLLPFALSVWLIGGLAGCGGNAAGDGAADSTFVDDTLRIALVPTAEAWPLMVAAEEGWLDTLAVPVQLLPFPAAMDADTAFCRGWANAELTDLVKAVTWRARGDSVRAVLWCDLQLTLVATPEAKVKKLRALQDKVIAMTRHSALDFMADRLLARANLNEKALNRPQINDIYLRQRMTDQRQYDGAILPEPYATRARVGGGTQIAVLLRSDSAQRVDKGVTSLPLNPLGVLLVSERAVGLSDTLVSSLQAAYAAGCDYLNAHGLPPALQEAADSLFVPLPFAPRATPSDSLLRLVNEWALRRGLTERSVSANEFLFTP